MADTKPQVIGLPIGKNKELIRGTLITNKNGDAEWYQGTENNQFAFPTFTSNKSNNYQWQPSPNCSGIFGDAACPTSEQRTNFYSNTSSISALDGARLFTFTNPISAGGFNSPQLAKQLKIPGAINTAPGDLQTGNSAPEPPGSSIPIGTPTTLDLGIPESNFLKNFGNPVRYPTDIGTNEQDYIKFDLVEYGSREFSTTSGAILQTPLGPRQGLTTIIASVVLPIQPQISDQNGVSWGEEQMNALQMIGAALAKNPNAIPDTVDKSFDAISGDSKVRELILKYVAGQAVGINPIARTDGLILNPNLELLFNNPTLRPFSFTFRLSPRNDEETVAVKKIIRFFKEGSVVRTTNTGLFLKAPNVFNISYNGLGEAGLNKIKTCALRNVSVNYTPDGSYMTFRDGTMTSYELSLQFSELEPIYDVDYNEVSDHPIGY